MVLIVGVGILFSAYNAFSKRGVSLYDVEVDDGASGPAVDVDLGEEPARLMARTMPGSGSAETKNDFDTRLRRLSKLKEDGLISEEEFQAKRDEIMRERW